MPMSTRPSNADAHPGRIVMEGQRVQRPKKQIEVDEARKKAAASVATHRAEEERQRVLEQLKESEDAIEREEEAMREHTARPDLWSLKYETPVDTNVDSKIAERDPCPSPASDVMDDDVIEDMDNDDIADRDSDSEQLFYAPTEIDAELIDESKSTSTLDLADNAPNSYSSTKKNAKKAKPSVSLRSEVDAMRHGTPNTATSLASVPKRKEPPAVEHQKLDDPKRLKRMYATQVIGGLSTDWKKRVPYGRHQGGSSNANTVSSNIHGVVHGGFNNDEPSGSLEQVKASKSTAPQKTQVSASAHRVGNVGGGKSAQSAQRKAEAEITLTRATKITSDELFPPIKGHQKYTVSDLPFPGGKTHYWCKYFVPRLVAWAGSQDDPFGTNNGVGTEAVCIWGQVFPAIKLTSNDHDALTGVSENTLNNWRSDMGKAGYGAILDIWNDNATMFLTPKDHTDFVETSLVGMYFVYEHPDTPGARGAFCSAPVAKVYAKHLRRILLVTGKYGPQIGALALATAAVKRGLTLFKTREDANGTRGQGFTDQPWGKRARETVRSTMKLRDHNWAEIEEWASLYIQFTNNSEDEGQGEEAGAASGVAMRANIDIDDW